MAQKEGAYLLPGRNVMATCSFSHNQKAIGQPVAVSISILQNTVTAAKKLGLGALNTKFFSRRPSLAYNVGYPLVQQNCLAQPSAGAVTAN